jgi:hypothetical protein
MGDIHGIIEGKGKGPKAPYDNTQAMLNDLLWRQQDMMNAITKMEISTQLIQNNMDTIDANITGGVSGSLGHHGGGASGSNGNPTGSSGHQTPTHTYILVEKIPRRLFHNSMGTNRLDIQDRSNKWDKPDIGKHAQEIHFQSIGETTWSWD